MGRAYQAGECQSNHADNLMRHMRLKKFVRGDTVIRYVLEGVEDQEPQEKSEKQWHPPNPELDQALRALRPVVVSWMEGGKDWERIMAVTGFALKRTASGTRSGQLTFTLSLGVQGGDRTTFTTPFVRIDQPEDGEDDKPVAEFGEVELLEAAITAAQEYITGKWQPGRLGAGGLDPEDMKEPKTEPLFDAS